MTPLAGTRPVHPTWPSVASPPQRALVVGVVAGRGGAGASTLAATISRHLARRTVTVLVDLDRASAGIDVLLGLEGADGVRWPDLADTRGEVSGADVLALLPRWGSCAVLSADRARPGAPEPAVVADVLHALTAEAGALVLDLDRAPPSWRESLVGACDAVLGVDGLACAPCGRCATAFLACALTLLGDRRTPRAWLLVRGPRRRGSVPPSGSWRSTCRHLVRSRRNDVAAAARAPCGVPGRDGRARPAIERGRGAAIGSHWAPWCAVRRGRTGAL